MSGFASHPSTGRGLLEGWAGPIPVLLVIAALIAGCAAPGPSGPVAGTDGPAATARATGPAGTPATPPDAHASAPLSTRTPDAGTWIDGVEIPPAVPVASFKPTRTAAAGVLTDSAFRLAALDGSDPVELARRVTAEPPLRLEITAADGAALVRPTEPLTQGQRYRFTLAAPDGAVQGTWAVQTVAQLAVAGSTPGDESTDVPLDTGIEVAFNQYGVDLAAAIPYIELSPAVKGRFEQEGKTIAFLPDTPLASSTLYTLTVRKGLALAGTPMALEVDVVVRFETTGTRPKGATVHPNGTLWESATAERAVIAVRVDRYWSDQNGEDHEYPMPKTLDIAVHQLDGIEAGIEAWRTIRAIPEWSDVAGAPVATAGLPSVVDTALAVSRVDPEDDDLVYLRLPASLPGGWYVITITHAWVPRQVVLQVTDLAVYSVVTDTRTVAWVNDLRTKEPVEGATAILAGARLGATDAQGLVTGGTPAAIAHGGDAAQRAVLSVRAGSQAVFVPTGGEYCEKCEGDGGVDSGDPYWLAFQSDRYVYRATDTINAWGVVRSRAGGAVPARVEVRLEAWDDMSASSAEIVAGTAKPDRNGAFLVQLPIRELPYGDYTLDLLVNGEPASSRSITLAPIEKPAWQLSVTTSRSAVISGATVRATIEARFFEGTPVAGARIAVEGTGSPVTLVTDASGAGTAGVRLRLDEESSSQWDVVTVAANPVLPEEAEIGADDEVAVFRAGVVLKSDAVIDGRRIVVSGSVHDVAFGRFERGDDPWSVDPFGKTRAGVKVRVKVVETIYDRHKAGTVYDWILKRVVPVYETTERTRSLGTTEVRSDAKGRYRVSLAAAARDRGYEVTITATDSAGRVTSDRAWAATRQTVTEDDSPYLESSAGDEPVSVGKTVDVTFTGGSGAGQPARYLWTVAHAGLRTAAITSVPRFAVTFRTADIPALHVEAVRFNGLAYEAAYSGTTVQFRVQDRALKVDVRPDRQRYAPGGRAKLAIRTTDASGRPTAASVYVGVVDDKLAALGLVDLSDPIEALYEDIGSGILGIGWTHRSPATGSGGEGGDTTGGGGDEDPRSDFRDWLVARIVRTGSDGRASVSFDLSDDLTSWRVYAAGVGGRMLAGTGDALLPVSLPFFAELTVAESYLAVDRPIVQVRGYGTGIAADATVTYKVSSDTLRMTPVTVTARAFKAAEVRLPALSAGIHRIKVEAVTGTGDARRRDSLVRSFEVVTTRTSQASVTSEPLDGPVAVMGGRGPTTLVLGDAGRGRVVPVLEELTTVDPVRGDRALAAGIATRILRDTFGMEAVGHGLDLDLDPFLRDGGYAVLPYSSPDLPLSALAAMSGDPRLGRQAGGFGWEDPTTREERIWVLAGMAATGDPVLAEIRALAGRQDLALPERVALADASVAAGDEDLAGRLLRDIMRDAGQRQGPWVRVEGGRDADLGIVLTARLAIAAAWLGEPVAAEMDAYLAANPARTAVVDLERALAAQGWVDRVPAADAVAALTVNGKRSEVRIDASEPVRVVLTPAQAASAKVEPVSGSVLVTTRTDRTLDASALTAPDWLRPVRTVSPAGAIDQGDTVIVQIRLKPPSEGPYGCLAVTELVPSGLVPIALSGDWVDEEDEGEESPATQGPWSIVGQRVDFCVDVDPEVHAVTLRYVARVVTPGKYRWEPTLVQSVVMPDVGAVISATTITIRGLR